MPEVRRRHDRRLHPRRSAWHAPLRAADRTGRLALDPDRLFPADEGTRRIARRLYEQVSDLPIMSPHGHTDPAWFALDAPFADPAELLIVPDHYVFRMLYSPGVPMEALGSLC